MKKYFASLFWLGTFLVGSLRATDGSLESPSILPTEIVEGAGQEQSREILPVSLVVTKRKKINISGLASLRSYANDYQYYFKPQLREGMRVLYSASYGMGKEAGQASGIIVERDGKFWFKQLKNPTAMQLLLPPGQPLNSNQEHSLWDMGAFMDLINHVAMGVQTEQYKSAHESLGYSTPDAYTVEFEGGTAGDMVKYSEAMEVNFKKVLASRSFSELKVIYAQGIGPVALEFQENLTPTGTFKLYIGE